MLSGQELKHMYECMNLNECGWDWSTLMQLKVELGTRPARVDRVALTPLKEKVGTGVDGIGQRFPESSCRNLCVWKTDTEVAGLIFCGSKYDCLNYWREAI